MPRIACNTPIAAFLDLIAASEATSTSPVTHDDGYDVIVSGVNGANTFTDYSVHPFQTGRAPIVVRVGPPQLESTASGRYQITLPTWRNISTARRLGTFSPINQDLGAYELVTQCSALDPIIAGDLDIAIARASETWASFPGNSYGQGGHTLDWLLGEYSRILTALA